MQLKALGLLAAGLALVAASAGTASAQVAEFDTSHSVYYEAPTRTHMFVYTPSADLQVSPWSWLEVRGGWEADVVSGASVATKAGAAYEATHGADVITTASVHDFRNVGHGEATLKGDTTSLTAGYVYSTEHDYRSNSFHVNARTDVLQHNTQFELAYARNFDSVCDRVQSGSESSPTRWIALEDSTGCFTDNPTRTTHSIDIDTYEASWAQSWTPVLATQLTYTGQLLDGFQADPYRSIVLGDGLKAQEHDPTNRARESLTARVAWYLRPIRAALRLSLRAYYDTWNIKSGTVEAEFEKSVGESLRLMARGRLYDQTGALFWSDDYTGGAPPLGPKGQYWTGDRELSPFWSWLLGVRFVWTLAPAQGRLLGVMESLKLAGSANVTNFSYSQYTLGGTPVTNARAYIATLTPTDAAHAFGLVLEALDRAVRRRCRVEVDLRCSADPWRSIVVVFGAAEAMLLGHVVQVLPVHLRVASGRAHVAAVAPEEPLHIAALEIAVVLRPRLPVAPTGFELKHVARRSPGGGKRHETELGLPGGLREVEGAVEHVAQLANVARPVVSQEPLHGVVAHGDAAPSGLEDVLDEGWNVFASAPERRHGDRHHSQTKVEVFSELAALNLTLKVALRRREHAHVRLERAVAADPPELLGLEHPQELRLHVERKLADLVEEHRAAVGELERALARHVGARERAALVAEQLALEERIADGAAVDHDERAGRACSRTRWRAPARLCRCRSRLRGAPSRRWGRCARARRRCCASPGSARSRRRTRSCRSASPRRFAPRGGGRSRSRRP